MGALGGDPVPCQCEQYAKLDPIRTLVSDSAAGLQLLNRDGARFDSRLDRAALEALAESTLESVPPECRAYVKLPGEPRFRVIARISSGTGYGPLNATYGSAKLDSRYIAMFQVVKSDCVRELAPTGDTSACTDPEGTKVFEMMGERFASADGYETLSNLPEDRRYSKYFSTLTSEEFEMMGYYHGFAMSKTEAESQAYLKGIAGTLTTDQKIGLVQMALQQWDNAYDVERMEAAASAKGSVAYESMQSAVQHNAALGYYGSGEGEETYSQAEFAGVCRDQALGGVRMLEALGAKDSYVVAYGTTSGAYHVDVITRFKDQPGSVYRLDTDGETNVTRPGDERALRALRADTAINYLLANSKGRIVADIPSEKGLLLAEAAGMNARDLGGGLVQTHSTLVGADLAIGKNDGTFTHRLRAVAASDSFGSEYYLTGGTHDWGTNSKLPGRLGWVAGVQNNPIGTYANDGKDAQQNGFGYLMLDQGVNSGELKLSDRVSTGFDSKVLAVFMGGHLIGEQTDRPILQGDFRYNLGFHVTQTGREGKATLTHAVTTQVTPGVADITDPHMPQLPIPVLNFAQYRGEYRRELGPEGEAALLVAATGVLNGDLGGAGRLEAGVAGKRLAALTFVEGPVLPGTAPYMPGTDPTVGGSLQFQLSRHARLSGEAAYGQWEGASGKAGLEILF